MTGLEGGLDALARLVAKLRDRGDAFAVATVVRTLGATAAKPGAKAVLDAKGQLIEGWIGGGCVRAALSRAATESLSTHEPLLVSLQPEALLDEKGLVPGSTGDGVQIARNGCPSEGSIDIFVEPHLPLPELVVLGASPVARALARLTAQFDWALRHIEDVENLKIDPTNKRRMVIVSTQGRGDTDGLAAALQSGAEFVAFVGSRKKYRALSQSLIESGFEREAVNAVSAPAGLAIDAVTPDEIALSILAQVTQERRRRQRERQGSPHTG